MFRFLFPLILTFTSCSLVPDPRPDRQVVLGAWNVHNLFDEVDDGDEYPEFDPQRGWDRPRFWARCSSLVPVIRSLAEGGPDLLVLEEIEGAHALEVLNTRFLADLGYRYSFLPPPSDLGVRCAVLSRFPFVRTGLLYPSAAGADEPLRPLVEAEVDLGGRALVVIGNHWKSRIPSPSATEGLRRESARVLSARIADLDGRPDHPLVVALGDFNTSLELSRAWPDKALVSPGSNQARSGALVVHSRRAQALESRVPGEVWDPWETVTAPEGSYRYRGSWDKLDHIFVSAASLRSADWAFGAFRAVAFAPEPSAWGPHNPSGISDHFPLVLTLVRRGP